MMPWFKAHRAAVLAACVIATSLTWRVDAYPLLEPDEGRNAAVMQEMAAENGYVLPRLNGLPYLDKPVVYFAAGALAMEVLGPTEKAARLPSILFTVGTLLLVAWFGRHLFGTAGMWIAVLATASSPLTVAYARTVIFDSALTFFVVGALVGFFLATESATPATPASSPSGPGGGGRQRQWSAIGWMATAAAILTKGPVALVFVLLVALPYAGWRRRWRAVLDPVGILACAALILPWVVAVSRVVPDFIEYVLVVETAQRVATPALGREGPVWYFIPILAAATLPWVVALVVGWSRRTLRPDGTTLDRRAVFLLLWTVVPLVFFTLSQSKRPQYILPLIPAVALLLARVWHSGAGVLPGARAAAGALVIAGGALINWRADLATLFDTSPAVAAAIPGTALWLGLAAAVAGSAAFALADRRLPLALSLALPTLAIPVLGMPLMQAIGADRSSRSLAETIGRAAPAETQVVGIGTFPLSLPFYTERPVVVATATGAELTSNYVIRNLDVMRRQPDSPLRPADWWRDALVRCERPRVFVVPTDSTRLRTELAEHLPLIGESRKAAAYGPCGSTATLARGS